MLRIYETLEEVVCRTSRPFHTSSRAYAVDARQAGPSQNRLATNLPRRSLLGRTSPQQRESEQLNKSITASRPTGKYYSPSFLNLERHANSRRIPRRFPLLGPPAAVAKEIDPLYRLGLHPGHPSLHDDSYKNPALISTYVSEMGKIQPRKVTELTRRSQREVGKAIRRARSMGLIPVMSRNTYAWRRLGR